MKYTYESSEMFLSMARKEYESEKERAAALDSKIAFSLPVVSAYFFLLAQDANIQKLWPAVTENGYSIENVRLFLILSPYVAAVATAFLSLFWMIHATWTHNFKELNIMQSNNAKVMSMSRELFSARIAIDYVKQVEKNRTANGRRSREYQTGWIFGIVSLVCFLTYTVAQWL